MQDQGETLGHLAPRGTVEDLDSTTLDQEDPLDKEVTQARGDREGAEATVGPRENLEIKDSQENPGNQARQGSQDRGDPEETLDLMEVQDQWATLGSPTAT